MADDTSAAFRDLAERCRAGLSPASAKLLDRLVALEPKRHGGRSVGDLGTRVVEGLKAAGAVEPAAERRDLARALIATLAVDAVARIESAGVTARVIERARAWQPRLLRYLADEAPEDYGFGHDHFLKDYRYAAGLTVPCGAQVVDLDVRIGPRTALRLARQSPVAAIAAIGSWFRPHTEGRYLDEFNEPGWEVCYREIADLLERHPRIRGLIATSWFYDPQLSTVSPRLAYLRETPMRGGARLIRHGTTPFDISSATATSASRRALYERGEYTPVSHSILWDRDHLIGWAGSAH